MSASGPSKPRSSVEKIAHITKPTLRPLSVKISVFTAGWANQLPRIEA